MKYKSAAKTAQAAFYYQAALLNLTSHGAVLGENNFCGSKNNLFFKF